MAGHGRKDVDDRLAVEVAAGRTLKDAAAAAGVSERTADRRMAEPAFKARVAELRGAMVADAAGRLAAGMTKAADVLVGLLDSADEDVRHRAAKSLIELATRLREHTEMAERVAELEARVLANQRQGGGPWGG